jgi:hypothetical protein
MNQEFTFLGLGSATNNAGSGQVKYCHAQRNTYIAGGVDADGVAEFQIQINGLHTLAAQDFVL